MKNKPKKEPEVNLTEEELKNLAGFFDVLIQMDLEQKRKAELMKEGETKPENP